MFSRSSEQRFSLRMLEPNEYYFDDYSVDYYPDGLDDTVQEDFKVVPGVLKVCSKSIVFVPSSSASPIIRIKQRAVSKIETYIPTGTSFLKTKKIDGDIFKLDSTSHNKIKNYVSSVENIRQPSTFFLGLLYVATEKVLPFLQQLNRASQLPSFEHQTMIAMIAHHRQSLYPFKSMFFDDLYEKELRSYVVDMVEPLVNVPGRVVVSDVRLYFQPFSNAFSVADILKWKLESISHVVCRTYILQERGLEVYIRDATPSNYLFIFDSEECRNSIYDLLQSYCKQSLEDSSQSNMTLKWQNGVISNYDYLLYLNNISDRTFNNLSQYPVFPWVISDYNSSSLDLENSATYRDLTKPIGALDDKRLNNIMIRYQEMPDPKFMYGSHYSTPGFVTYYMMRSQPDLMLCLMGGKFDHPDRVFTGIHETWENVLSNSADFKELIPQFYDGDGLFLENRLKLNLGKRQNGTIVNDVVLPPWADNPKDFIKKMRVALESDYVSSTLHHWIDLIFGYKQRGALAEKNHNIFHHLSYPGSIDLDSIVDPNEKNSIITQILEFGQVPQQVFTKPHPERKHISISPYPTLQVDNMVSDSASLDSIPDENLPNPEDSKPTLIKRSISNPGSSLDKYKLKNKVTVKEHVTFFIECPESKTIFIGSASGLLYTYRLPDMAYVLSVIISNMSLTCSIDMGHSLCVGSSDGKFYFLSKQQSSVYLSFTAHYDTITDIRQDNNMCFSASSDSSVKVWNMSVVNNVRVKALSLVNDIDHDDKVQSIAVSGPILVSCVVDSIINVWDWDAMEVLHTMDYSHKDICHVEIWNNKIILLGLSVCYIDLHTLEEDFSKRFDELITTYQINHDHNVLLLAEDNGRISVLDLVNGLIMGEIQTDQNTPPSIYMNEGLLLLANKSKHFAVYETEV